MADSLEPILEDLYNLDPLLREHERDVQAILMSLHTEKPTIEIDNSFKDALKEKLAQMNVPRRAETHSFNWWFARLAPVPIALLLFFVLVPERTTAPTPAELPINDTGAPVETREIEAPTMRTMKQSESTDTSPEMFSVQMAANTEQENQIQISPQHAGNEITADSVSLTTPGFVVVYARNEDGNPDEQIGVSALLPIGHTERVFVSLTEPLQATHTYWATLYLDTGDRVFNMDSDSVVYDEERGGLYRFPFGVTETK